MLKYPVVDGPQVYQSHRWHFKTVPESWYKHAEQLSM